MLTVKNKEQVIKVLNNVESKDINKEFIEEVILTISGSTVYPIKDTTSCVLEFITDYLYAIRKVTGLYYYDNSTEQMRCKLFLLTLREVLRYVNDDGTMFNITEVSMGYDKLVYSFIPQLKSMISLIIEKNERNAEDAINNLINCIPLGGLRDIVKKFININCYMS